jgi:hypothetical protein
MWIPLLPPQWLCSCCEHWGCPAPAPASVIPGTIKNKSVAMFPAQSAPSLALGLEWCLAEDPQLCLGWEEQGPPGASAFQPTEGQALSPSRGWTRPCRRTLGDARVVSPGLSYYSTRRPHIPAPRPAGAWRLQGPLGRALRASAVSADQGSSLGHVGRAFARPAPSRV